MNGKKVISLLIATLMISSCNSNNASEENNKSNNESSSEITSESSSTEHSHTFSEEWNHDETYHWHDATCGHDIINDKEEHTFDQTNIQNSSTIKNELSCTEPARYYKTCICGMISSNENDVYEVGTPTGHSFSNEWSYNATHHWHASTCGHDSEKKDNEEHNFNDTYKVTEDGNKHYRECNICNYQTTPEDHLLTNWFVSKEATLNETGEKYCFCDLCNHKVIEIIPKLYSSVSEINDLIEKIGELSSIKMLDGSLIEETMFAYRNLSNSDKLLINNYNVLENAFTKWESQYEMVYDPLINGLPNIENHTTSIGHDDKYGTILKINVPPISDTSQFDFSINSNEYSKDSILHIFIKSPFESSNNISQSMWIGNFDREFLYPLNPKDWTEISSNGKNLSNSGLNSTKLVENITLQRYLNDTTEEYSGEYYLASIIAEKRSGAEGSVVIPVISENINFINTWGSDESTVSSYTDQEHGNGVELNITAFKGAYEIKINGVDKNKASLYDFVYCYVYAPISSKFYFSQKDWRNNVMTVDVSPDDSSNKTVSDAQAFYPAGWNQIIIPVSYLPDSSYIYFEIYTEKALGKWIITDFCGGYSSKFISNAATRQCGLSTLNSSSGRFEGTFTKGKDDTYGNYDEISITDLSNCTWGATIKVSGDAVSNDHQFLRFYVYSPLEYPISMCIYGNGWYTSIFPDGHMFYTCLYPKQWNEVIITTNCYNDKDDAFKKFDFANMTIFFEDVKNTTNVLIDGLKISSFELFDSYPEDASTDITYDINDNAMYVLGTSNIGNQQIMGFVLTYNQKVFVIDGGVKSEYRQLKNILTSLGGHVDYQIFTHAHKDHYGTYLEMYNDPDIDVDNLVYNFSSWDNLEQFLSSSEDKALQNELKTALDLFTGNVITCEKGTTISFDDFNLEFLNNRFEITGDINEASMCFKITTGNNSVLFLGDLSMNNAPKLLNEYQDNLSKLSANYLQLAHHGQRGGSKELYEAINPNYAIWCTTVRNYNNWSSNGYNTGPLESITTKQWLNNLGAIDICPFYKTIKIDL